MILERDVGGDAVEAERAKAEGEDPPRELGAVAAAAVRWPQRRGQCSRSRDASARRNPPITPPSP